MYKQNTVRHKIRLTGRFLLLLHHTPGTVCHFMSLQRHLCRLSDEKAEAVFVRPQFPRS